MEVPSRDQFRIENYKRTLKERLFIYYFNSTVKVFVPLQALNLWLQWYFFIHIFHSDIVPVRFAIAEMFACDFFYELTPGITGTSQKWYATPFGDLIHFPLFYFADILQIKTTWFLDLNYHYYLYNLLLLRRLKFASNFLRVPISECWTRGHSLGQLPLDNMFS